MDQGTSYLDELFYCPLLEACCPRGEERAVECGKGYVEQFDAFLCFRDYAVHTCSIAREAVTAGSRISRRSQASQS